jgi:hypothetical protein
VAGGPEQRRRFLDWIAFHVEPEHLATWRRFRRALKQFQRMVLAGQLENIDQLMPFGEHDGVMVVDAQHRIQYVSGIATSMYRKLGYAGDLLKRYIEDLEPDDYSPVLEALVTGECCERETKVRDLIWVKKAIPLFAPRRGLLRRGTEENGPWRLEGALVAIHDETDARRQEEELQVKVAMIREIHHRVKNNMQTVASLLRLQSRRAASEETRRALQEGVNRILSVAVIHEFLAHQAARVINIRDVGQRIIEQTLSSNIPGETGIEERHGNRYYRIHRPANINAPLQATLRWTVARATVIAGDTGGAGEAELGQYLTPNSLVPVGHKILQPILAEIHAIRKDDSPEATARAIYDWVVDNVEYK